MILVLAGTRDGRELALELAQKGYNVLLSVVSTYGGALVRQSNLAVRVGALDELGLKELILESQIQLVIDASHPYAANVSINTMAACSSMGLPYIRYERPVTDLPDYSRLYTVASAAEAAQTASSLGEVLFLTIGSRTLSIFKNEPSLVKHRIIARVLPDVSVLQECFRLGFHPRDIVAMEGPFSHELNVAMFRQYQAGIIITKNSGSIGGTDAKITAAMELNLPLVVIDRPAVTYGVQSDSAMQIIQHIKEAL